MDVSIIIATMGLRSRACSLKRAIQSIREASSQPLTIIVVVNGSSFDADLCSWLKVQPDVTFDYLIEPSFHKALKRGVELVKTDYYGFLDDDDEFIDMAIDKRLSIMKDNLEIDCVISNGFRQVDDKRQVAYSSLEKVENAPLLCLMNYNWLASCNFLFRRTTLDSDFFNDIHQYSEWTWLAFKLSIQNKKIAALQDFTFIINDTAGSLSKSTNYINSYISLFEKMLDGDLPKNIQKTIQAKLAAAYHDASDHALKLGDIKLSLKYHIKSIFRKNGYKYLSYTRHFFKISRNK